MLSNFKWTFFFTAGTAGIAGFLYIKKFKYIFFKLKEMGGSKLFIWEF